jgi:hypothetical protein
MLKTKSDYTSIGEEAAVTAICAEAQVDRKMFYR